MSETSGYANTFVVPKDWNLPNVIRRAFAEDFRASPQMWLSGGGAVRVLLGKANEGVWAGDWDLYCTPKAFARLQEGSGLVFEPEAHEYEGYYDMYQNQAEQLHVFVGKQFTIPNAIFYAFDLSVVRVALSAGGVIFDLPAFDDLQQGVVRTCVLNDENEARLEKYRKRGFRVLSMTHKAVD